MDVTITRANLDEPDFVAFIDDHLRDLEPTAPPESRHALAIDGLRGPGIRVWVARADGEVVGSIALAPVEAGHEELKSMRTLPALRGQGIGGALLDHALADAKARNVRRVSLETGASDFFDAAIALYRSRGFVPCAPFGTYRDDPLSRFLTLPLDLPDPDRVGGPGWVRSTGGVLSTDDRRRMLAQSLATQGALLAQRVRPRRRVDVDLSEALHLPDTRLVLEAVDAARAQSPLIIGHSYRTAVFARALALVDGVTVDHELLTVCALLHDAGLEPSVAGEDFTLRSAAVAVDAARRADRLDACASIEDAIVVHTTVGVDVERDGALGVYTQYGAMVDLVGLRERHLPYDLVARTVNAYPRTGLARRINEAVGEEARAVPGGRFDFLRRVGFGAALRVAAVPSRR